MLDFWRVDRFFLFGATKFIRTFMVVEDIRRFNQLKWRISNFSWGFIATGGAGCLNHQQYGLIGRETLGEMMFWNSNEPSYEIVSSIWPKYKISPTLIFFQIRGPISLPKSYLSGAQVMFSVAIICPESCKSQKCWNKWSLNTNIHVSHT